MTDLATLQTPEQYATARSTLYPSETSLRWFIRRNRPELVEAEAITCPTGQWLVIPDKFDRVAMEIGKRRARAGL
ncbi:MAG TPA: hypothetical protein VFR90_04965 [Methylibium sp.]|uniref:hypothetical protein n=1 Tax=Methylibium sp. TaxID=2067992 RepID=UPI002DB9CDC4|nr:hypothetical protein [Methylibium sp.]HEU4458452.1 hypothetical protein [Methylibium sp.]